MKGDALTSDGLKILAVLALVVLNGFFVAAELALVRIRDTQLEALAVKGNRRAKIARSIVGNIDAYIGATQFGITLASMALGVVIEPVFHHLLQPLFSLLKISSFHTQRTIAILVGFFVNSYLLIVAGELAPKAMAIRKTLETTLFVASPLRWFYRLSFPFIWVLNHSAQWLLRQFGIAGGSETIKAHSEEELRLLLSSAQKISGTTGSGRRVALNALDLRRRLARDVMRPRQEIVAFDTEATIAECMEIAEKTRYSRFPLCEAGDLDRTLGVIHIKDLYAARQRAQTGRDLRASVRKLIYVPETARLEKLLQLFLERKLHFAIVVDEYGGTIGLVTLENILEELVGQIQDEFDQENPLLVRRNETTWEVAGALPLHELDEVIGEPLQEEGITTVSGWVTHRLGGFPKVGDVLTVGAFELQVEQMDGTRVAKLKVTKRPAEETSPVT
ncbi:MAG TPA: hemolysin family protein [Verrucomicrobiae bacterium]|nr:hemolysin family protein [Verrucomicrobiae bacterium]